MEKREKAQGDQHVVEDGDYRSSSVDPLKPECNIYQHTQQRIERSEHRLAPQLSAHLRADDLHISNREIAQGEAAGQRIDHLWCNAWRAFQLIEARHDAALIFIAGVYQPLRQLFVTIAGIRA